MRHNDDGVGGPHHHHRLAHSDRSSLLPGGSPTPSQAADLHQATSTNGTGSPAALLKRGKAPSPTTAQAAATREVPGKHQALMGAPSLGVLLSGQDMLLGHSFQGLSPHLLLAGDYPPPPPCPSSPCHRYSSSPSSTRPDAHSGPARQACRLTHVRQDQSTRTHGLVPPLTPPRRLAFSLLSNSGSSIWDAFIWLHQHCVAKQAPLSSAPQF